jgi:exonuclease III
MRVASLNVQNLRLREDADGRHFDGARDETAPLSKLSAAERALDCEDRSLTAQLIGAADADILALQEIFDQRTLDGFHDACLAPLGIVYPTRVCLPGNDGRRQVALMSRRPLQALKSHATLSYAELDLAPPPGQLPSDRIFRRDCLTAWCDGVWLLGVHFKAPTDAATLSVMRAEAMATRILIERQFADPSTAPWLIVGDVNVNDVERGDALDILTDDFAVDLGVSLPAAARFTYFHARNGSYARPDRMLASPALAARCKHFHVRRDGMSLAAVDGDARFHGVGRIRPRASDHALVVVDLVAGG